MLLVLRTIFILNWDKFQQVQLQHEVSFSVSNKCEAKLENGEWSQESPFWIKQEWSSFDHVMVFLKLFFIVYMEKHLELMSHILNFRILSILDLINTLWLCYVKLNTWCCILWLLLMIIPENCDYLLWTVNMGFFFHTLKKPKTSKCLKEKKTQSGEERNEKDWKGLGFLLLSWMSL